MCGMRWAVGQWDSGGTVVGLAMKRGLGLPVLLTDYRLYQCPKP